MDPDFRIETGRLRLRPYEEDDLVDLHAMFSDPEHMTWYPAPFESEESRAWLERQRSRHRERGWALLIVEDRETGEFLGTAGPAPMLVEGVEHVEIGWHTKPGAQGAGHRARGRRGRARLGVREPGGRPPDLPRASREHGLEPRRAEDRDARRPRGRPQGDAPLRLPDRPRQLGGASRGNNVVTEPPEPRSSRPGRAGTPRARCRPPTARAGARRA